MLLPVCEKDCDDGDPNCCGLRFGVASMQGWREEMEDAHVALPDFDPEKGISLFGVFDGHGGGAVALLVSKRLPNTLRSLEEYRAGEYKEALRKAFLQQDEYLRSPQGKKN